MLIHKLIYTSHLKGSLKLALKAVLLAPSGSGAPYQPFKQETRDAQDAHMENAQ